jgi:CubicO group peptidase (beta-lactamase class C family)
MTRVRRVGALAALALAVAPMTSAHSQSLHRSIDSVMAVYAQPAGPGASLLVVRDGRVAYMKGYGLADVEQTVPVTAQTDFRLASLSKQFTATAVMLLVADGRLRYDDDVSTLVAGLPAFARGITVRNLLNHTSGLPDYEDFVPDSQTAQVHDRDVPALISHAAAMKFAPGTRYAYSNTGYCLLALVVEHASGRRFADFLHDRIFAPLGMSGTLAFEEGRSTVPHRAYGYTVRPSGVIRTDQSNTSGTLGDGGIYTSVTDLVKWDRALERHTLVSAAAQQLAWTPPSLPGGAATDYGFGWFVDRARGTTRLWHYGESRGFTNAILRYPARRLTVVILTNRTGGKPWDLAERIADLYLPPAGGVPTPPPRP